MNVIPIPRLGLISMEGRQRSTGVCHGLAHADGTRGDSSRTDCAGTGREFRSWHRRHTDCENVSRACDYHCRSTASTIALRPLRKAFPIPIVGTVPAIKPAAALTKSRLVSVLATPGTVAREYTRELIAQYGAGTRFNLVGAPALAELAEMSASGSPVEDSAIAGEIAPACFVEQGGAKTDVVVLGCTHYPLLLDRLDALAPWPVIWLDPAPAIARRIANVLAEQGHIVGVGAKHGPGTVKFTSGRTPSASLSPPLRSHNLSIAPFVAAAAA